MTFVFVDICSHGTKHIFATRVFPAMDIYEIRDICVCFAREIYEICEILKFVFVFPGRFVTFVTLFFVFSVREKTS